MFGFGHGPELIIIIVIALIVLGPGKLPEIMQLLGRGIRELRQASADLQKTFDVNEFMNPAPSPPAPPPTEAAPTTVADAVAPPAETAEAKPKRTRKKAAPANGAGPASAQPDDSASTIGAPDIGSSPTTQPVDGSLDGEPAPAIKPPTRRRASKKPAEPVSPA
jgi:TatA/E family protein of Tat protein translocase